MKEAERNVFKSAFRDGLWDVFIGCMLLIFAVAPFLSRSMGDFWSSAVFLPFWAVVYIAIRLIRKHVVTPRIGVVKFGRWRRGRMLKFNITMFIVLVVALGLGILSAVRFESVPGWVHTARFSLVMLVGFSIAAYFLDFKRLYLYAALIALSPVAGEWLWVRGHAPHHGFPVTFGITAGVIILVGLLKLVALVRGEPVPDEERLTGETNDV